MALAMRPCGRAPSSAGRLAASEPRCAPAPSPSPLSSRRALRACPSPQQPPRALPRSRGRCTAAPASASLFKQTKDSVQWLTVGATFVAVAACIVPLLVLPRHWLGVAAAVVLGCVALSLAVEAVRDSLRAAALERSGEKAAWKAKAESVAAAAEAKAAARGAASAPTSVVSAAQLTWDERNVAGAASAEDARLIRETNEFLQ